MKQIFKKLIFSIIPLLVAYGVYHNNYFCLGVAWVYSFVFIIVCLLSSFCENHVEFRDNYRKGAYENFKKISKFQEFYGLITQICLWCCLSINKNYVLLFLLSAPYIYLLLIRNEIIKEYDKKSI